MTKLIDDDFESSYDVSQLIKVYFILFLLLQFISNDDNIFTLKTDYQAPKYQLVNVDITNPDKVCPFYWSYVHFVYIYSFLNIIYPFVISSMCPFLSRLTGLL